MKEKIVVICLCWLLAGCNAMQLDDFKGQEPHFDLFDYFQGHSKAWGIFEDRFGNLRRQFTVEINGEVTGNLLTLTEDFSYSDGEKDQRIWYIEKIGENKYQGKAADVLGVAEGQIVGNALHWVYQMNLKVGEGHWKVTFDDWMFLQDEQVLINKARVKRWNIEIGQVSIFFLKS